MIPVLGITKGRKMAEDDFPMDTASNAKPFKVGILPTEDGDKVVLVVRSQEHDQEIFWLEPSEAMELAEALLAIACRIEDGDTDQPQTRN